MGADEKSLIARIVRALPHTHPAMRLGAGDDAAVIRGARQCVITCDAFLEGVHFLTKRHPADSVGYKSLARAASDVAAMGAPLNSPKFFLLALALPREKSNRWLDEFLRGMRRCARELRITLAGGDVSEQARVAISVTVMAMAGRGALLARAGARAGEALYVSGQLGAAQRGLELLRNGKRGPKRDARLHRHLYPRIRMEMGAWLAQRRLASAMIDTSDGLSTDLGNLCAASGVGARIFAEALPVAGNAGDARARQRALHGGEDYELLFTARRDAKIPGEFGGVQLTRIGEITRERKIELAERSGRRTRLAAGGWDPFRKKRG